jgi:4-hydroxy-tetrahydrodipicolinate synthase
VANNLEDIKILRDKVAFVNNSIYCVGKNASRITKGIKCALSVMDICEDYMALPLRKFENREREKVKQFLDQFEGSKVI